MKILIITGGRIDENFALLFLRENIFDHIIVVDGALAFWDKVEKNTDITAHFDHLVGDFDSVSPQILKKYTDRDDITVHRFIPEKDYTDTDIAVRLAIELAGKEAGSSIYIIGALGTRMDHTLANIQLLCFIKKAGMEGVIIDERNRIRFIESGADLRKADLVGKYISLIPVTERLEHVRMKGFKYEVDDLEVVKGETRCVSNEAVSDNCSIRIGNGSAFLIESRD